MLRLSEGQYAEHQARVKRLKPQEILDELGKAVRWTKSPDPKIAEGGTVALGMVTQLLSMEHMNQATRVEVAGVVYDSKSEAKRHQVLLMREKAGLIRELVYHPDAIELVIEGMNVGSWKPDFQYFEPWVELERGHDRWRQVWEDVKGFTSSKSKKTGKVSVNPIWRAFKFKAKVIQALYPDVDIRVITRDKLMV